MNGGAAMLMIASLDELTTIWDQISGATKTACGAREPVADPDGGYIHFRVTVRRGAFHKVVVHLMRETDLYTVQLVRIDTRAWDDVIENEQTWVCAEQLSDIIYRMCNR